MSSRVSPTTLAAVISAGSGALLTVLLGSALIARDPELAAAEQRYRELSPAEAQRLQSTFERLRNAPDERRRIQSIHQAVSSDPELHASLEQLYDWWTTRSDAQRADLRELHANADLWVEETRRQYTDSMSSGRIELLIPARQGRGGPDGPPTIYVTRDQVDRFLQDAVPESVLASDESTLLQSVDPADQSLVRILIIARHLFSDRQNGRPIDQDTIRQVYQSATSHLLPADRPVRRLESRGEALRALVLLRSIKNYLSADFLERHSVSDPALEQQFSQLETSERLRYMSADPEDAVRSLQTQLTASDQTLPTSELAQWLEEFDRRSARVFLLLRGEMRGGGPPGEDRRRRGDNGRGSGNRFRFPPGLGGPDDGSPEDRRRPGRGFGERGPGGERLGDGPPGDGPPGQPPRLP